MYYKMQETLRLLKINPACRGVMYIMEVLEGTKKIEDLNDDQIELIVDAWDSRAYIPEEIYQQLSGNGVDVVKPSNEKNLPREEYYREVAENVINFFRWKVNCIKPKALYNYVVQSFLLIKKSWQFI